MANNNREEEKNKLIGALGEGLAAHFLEDRGYRILAKNYRKPWGEIDVVAEKDGLLAFVEVKTNSSQFPSGFSPELRVDYRKTDRLIKTAQTFLDYFFAGEEKEWRIDIISVVIEARDRKARITHFKNVV